MATLLLGMAGGYLFPAAPGAFAWGAFGGAILGGIVDNFAVFPTLFPRQSISGPKLDGIALSSANEGVAIEWGIGAYISVPGTVIWLDELEPVETTKKVGGSGGGGKVTTTDYYISLACLVCEANGPQDIARIRKILGDAKIIWENGEEAKYDAITFYFGDQTTPDPLMEAKLGAGNVPAHKDSVFFVIERLYTNDFGAGRVPALRVRFAQDENMSVGEAIQTLAERHGVSLSDIDVTRIPFCFRGMNLSGPQEGTLGLEAILGTYALVPVEADGKLYFQPKGYEIPIDIDLGDIGLENKPGYTIVDRNDIGVPDTFELRYVSVDLDLQPGLAVFRNQTTINDGDILTMSTPLSLKAAEAHAIAKREMLTRLAERRTINLMLPPKMHYLTPGDVIRFTDDRTYTVFCSNVAVGPNYQVQIEGHLIKQAAYKQAGIGNVGDWTANGSYSPPELLPLYLDMAAVHKSNTTQVGVYYCTQTDPVGESFLGALLYSSDDDIDYEQNGVLPYVAEIGSVDQGLQTDINAQYIDDLSELVVTFEEGTFASAAEADVIQGKANIFAIQTGQLDDGTGYDWEIIGVVTVTGLGNNQWKFTKIYRGLRGTEQLCSKALLAGGKIIKLTTDNSVRFWDAGLDNFGSTKYLKLPAVGDTLGNVNSQEVQLWGRSVLPFAPYELSYQFDGSLVAGTPVIRWLRRTKEFVDFLTDTPPYTTDEENRFLIRVYAGGIWTPPIYEEEVDGTEWLFTDAKQTEAQANADAMGSGWVANNGFNVTVQQISSLIGPGKPAILEVNR